MLQIRNRTGHPASVLIAPDPEGVDSISAILKASFTLEDSPRALPEQLPIAFSDEYRGDPGTSSLSRACDVGFAKPATDVIVTGHAWARMGRPASQMDVGISLGSVRKLMRVFGDRTWEGGLVGHRMSAPRPFEKVPLVWERAFGGLDQISGREPKLVGEGRNPVGVGYCHAGGQKKVEGMLLPNVEDPRQVIKAPTDRPTPAGFGPVCPHWEPRRNFAGTYDAAWLESRAPYLPKDFDPRFFQSAPHDQLVTPHLRGGETGELLGLTAEGSLRFSIPRLAASVTFRLDQGAQKIQAVLDTVLIEPDYRRLVLVWRCALRCDKQTLRVREIEPELARVA